MARSVHIKCAQCDKEAIVIQELDTTNIPKALDAMPSGWRTATLDLGFGTRQVDLCSFKCSVQWARQEIITIITDAERRGQYVDED